MVNIKVPINLKGAIKIDTVDIEDRLQVDKSARNDLQFLKNLLDQDKMIFQGAIALADLDNITYLHLQSWVDEWTWNDETCQGTLWEATLQINDEALKRMKPKDFLEFLKHSIKSSELQYIDRLFDKIVLKDKDNK